ncbi:MAG: hypothetical protein ABJB12_20275 [Pseudomonadota bacterium]
MRAWRLRSVLAGVSVRLPHASGLTLLPEECACCGQAATHHSALARKGDTSVLVGYCDECAEHQASASSRVLALSLASLLLAFSGAAGVPLFAPKLGLYALIAVVTVLSLVPLLVLLMPTRRMHAEHAVRGAAVLWSAQHTLWCARTRYAERVLELNGGELREEPLHAPVGSAWLSAGPVLGIGAACLSFFVYHPLLRVLNLGTTRIQVALDGAPLAAVDPTSNESPAAGSLLRVPAGRHWLVITSAVDGAALGRMQADFQTGAVHLLAFGADDTCFWLETNGYGQEHRAAPSYEALRSPEHFWVLPGGIDTWFGPNPIAAGSATHSSGGLLTALRQAPCAEAPQEVRAAP